MIVVVGPKKSLTRALAQTHQRRLAVPRHRMRRAREKKRFDVGQPVEALEQIVRSDFAAANGEGRVAMRDDEDAHHSLRIFVMRKSISASRSCTSAPVARRASTRSSGSCSTAMLAPLS